MNNLLRALMTAGALLGPVSAAAVPVTWTVDEWRFEDGGEASGQFTFDADTGTYSDIAIVTSGGTAFTGAVYGVPHPSGPAPKASFLFLLTGPMTNYTNTPILALNWLQPLGGDGGTVDIDVLGQSFEGACVNAACDDALVARFFTTGSVVAVSEPPALALFALFLLGGGLIRLRRNSRGSGRSIPGLPRG